jgi:hypothetical protein
MGRRGGSHYRPRCGIVMGILLGVESSGPLQARGSCVGLPPLPPEGVSRQAAAWGRCLARIMTAVLWFLLHLDEDLFDAWPDC